MNVRVYIVQREHYFLRYWKNEDYHFHPHVLTKCAIIFIMTYSRILISVLASLTIGSSLYAQEPQVTVPDGFKVEKIYQIPGKKQGSWVSMTWDDRGRLITSDQYGGLFRVTLEPFKVEPIDLKIGGAQGLLWHQGALYVSVAGKSIVPAGLYKLTDTKGNDQLDKIELLTKLNTGGEHGPHSLVASPDGKWIYMVAGNFTRLPKQVKRFPATNKWGEDHLLPRMADGKGHANGLKAPGGWIIRFTPDAKTWELVSSGFRNAYDMAFNEHGELIAYDADMEYDFGAPWYRPTRMCHAISGAEFGWRHGTGKWPSYYLDSMPGAVDIGPGSPTGVVAGLGAKFPEKYQRAIFALDWTFATMYAIHLQPKGSTYTGKREAFLSSTGLPLTDAVIGADGAMYFMVGGRRAGSALYKLSYVGTESTEPITPSPLPKAFALRRKLEAMHLGKDKDLELILSSLSHSDRTIRYTARVALEKIPVRSWIQKMKGEQNVSAFFQMSVAIARQGTKSQADAALVKLAKLDFSKLTTEQKLELLRAQALLMSRHGKSSAKLVAQLEPHFPDENGSVNRELCRVLCYLDAPGVISKTLALMAQPKEMTPPDWVALAGRNERYGRDIVNMLKNLPSTDSLHYAYCLRGVKAKWTEGQRRQYFTWFSDAVKKDGGKSYKIFITNIYKEALANASKAEQKMIASWKLDMSKKDPFKNLPVPKGPGKNWTVEAVTALDLKGANLVNGEKMFRASYCAVCHGVKGKGGGSGPDLTHSAGRFKLKDFAEAILNPSDVISNQYEFSVISKKDGSTVVGKILQEKDGVLIVANNAFDFEKTVEVNEVDKESIKTSPVSPMPPALINRLNEKEVKDLMAYLLSLK